MHDLVIRNGLVYDGTGDEPRLADVAVDAAIITKVGAVSASGREEIDATGKLVTPGFVDIHTHYDGQVTWDPLLTPSCYHGVTTVVMGNCGVGFAPCKAEQRDWLIGLMEGVEDIPGTALHAGIDWQWESFPEYLDALERKPLAIDVGTQVPHAALRVYVMGQRGAEHAPATPEEMATMASLVSESIQAGALGFSTSRTEKHRDSGGVLTPSITAHEDELVAIATALGKTGTGVMQGISDFYDFDSEFAIFKAMAKAAGRPISLTVEQMDARPEWWLQLLDGISQAQEEGIPMFGQVPPRANGVLLGLTATLNPFSYHQVYQDIHALPLEERVAIMRSSEFRNTLLASKGVSSGTPLVDEIIGSFHKIFRLGEPANYEPGPDESFAGQAAATGLSAEELIYDAMLENDGRALLYEANFNYQNGLLDHVETMMNHPYTFMGLSDAGAHCGVLCDASYPTTLIQHWGRDRSRGDKQPLQLLIKKQTSETAQALGLLDRGLLKPGYKADVNIIDYDKLKLHHPEVVYDLPAQGRRLMQKASGYNYTIVSGRVAFRDGESTGALHGKLIRGVQQAPAQ